MIHKLLRPINPFEAKTVHGLHAEYVSCNASKRSGHVSCFKTSCGICDLNNLVLFVHVENVWAKCLVDLRKHRLDVRPRANGGLRGYFIRS